MAIYEMTAERIIPVKETSFWVERLRERDDLQRLLRDSIDIVAPDTMVIAEEFGEWDESKRRIDLLALDKAGNLVVVELKRTDDGGHMELQAVRYAAMVSSMTFDQVVAAHKTYLIKRGIDGDARDAILAFLGWAEAGEAAFAQSVRIVLVAEGFSKELTTTVLWLNDRDLDIRCVRAKPYSLDETRVLLDVQQTIPLPEAAEYQVQIRNKAQEQRVARTSDRTQFDVTINGVTYPALGKRHTIFRIVRRLVELGVTPEQLIDVLPDGKRRWLWVDGNVSNAEFKSSVSEKMHIEGKGFDERRWFLDDNELIYVRNRTYAFHNQWGYGVEFPVILDAVLAIHQDHGISYQISGADSLAAPLTSS